MGGHRVYIAVTEARESRESRERRTHESFGGGSGGGGDSKGNVSIGSGDLHVDGGANCDSGAVRQSKKRDGGTDSGTGES